ncbi:MAG TPA: amino acid adenylation domain-containing protein [Longimicrobiaceae bacterium]|nr:amino acid adenylation domain-containing protein [Longimicrobiaceae bacterium]
MKFESVQERFGRVAAEHPDAPAIDFAGGEVTYAELDRRSGRLAAHLRAHAAGEAEVVAILTAGPVEMISSILGTLRAGGVFAPLDATLPDGRLRMMLEEVSPAWVVTETPFAARVASLLEDAPFRSRVLLLDGEEHASGPDAPAEELPSDPDAACYVYFTSGSTGRPKAIAGRARGLAHFIRWETEALGVGTGWRVSHLLPPTFDGSLRDIFLPLCTGGTICVPEGRETILDAPRLAEWLDAARVDVVHCVPSLFRSLVNEPLTPIHFPALKYVLMAGEPLLPADVGRWTGVFGDRVTLVNLYGTSETTMAKFAYFVRPEDRDRPFVPIGKPIEGARAILLDDRGKVCAPGVVGEIYIRTPYRSHGYYNRPDLTREVFVQNPFSDDPGDLVHRTGDLGRLMEDGNFEYLGRRDGQVKIRGIRVELGEIENLLRARAGVRDVAVVDRKDAEGSTYLCAYVVLEAEEAPGALRAHLLHYLPESMVPSRFVSMEELPRTISGKIDRRSLPEPSPEGETERDYVAPRNPVEEVVAGIWAEVLGVARVGVQAEFFDIGGHSLLATRVLSRVRAVLEAEVPLGHFFDNPTVAATADYIAQARDAAEKVPPLLPADRTGEVPLSFAQQRLWYVDQADPGNPAYNMPYAVRFRGALDAGALERALNGVVRRHEALRTRFPSSGGRPTQEVVPEVRIDLPVADLAPVADGEREAELRARIAREAALPFDLAAGPLVRAQLLRVDEGDRVLLLTMHHIVSDGWSMGILVEEVAELYRAEVEGGPARLPELPVQYADFALWQRGWLQGEALERRMDYWREALADPPVLSLPIRHGRGADGSREGEVRSRTLPAALLRRVKALGREEGATLYMILLAGYKVLLHRYTQQSDLVVGLPIANRNRAEVERLIGFFVNTLALRTDLSGDPPFREVLQRVRRSVLGAYAHQDVPFEAIVATLPAERRTSAQPLFQTLFVLQNTPEAELQLPGLTLSPLPVEDTTAKFDLTLGAAETPEGLTVSAQYRTAVFDAEAVDALLEHLECLLESAVGGPDARISALPMMTRAEQEMVQQWSMA